MHVGSVVSGFWFVIKIMCRCLISVGQQLVLLCCLPLQADITDLYNGMYKRSWHHWQQRQPLPLDPMSYMRI